MGILSMLGGGDQSDSGGGLLGLFGSPEKMAYLAMIAKGLQPNSEINPQQMLALAQKLKLEREERLREDARLKQAQSNWQSTFDQRERLANMRMGGDDPEVFGINPVVGEGGRIGQLSNKGNFRETQLPEGFISAKGNRTVSTPTETLTLDAGGNIIKREPKDNVGKAEADKIGAGFGEDFTEIQKATRAATARIGMIGRMRTLSDQAYEGAGAPGLQYARSLMATFGIDPGKVPAGEEFTQLGNKMTMDILGGKLGAQISDADRAFVATLAPGIANTKEGRARMLDVAEKLAKRDIDVGRMADSYRKQMGNLSGFSGAMATWAEANPLFPEAKEQGGSGGKKMPEVGEVRRGYRFRGGNPADPKSWEKIQ